MNLLNVGLKKLMQLFRASKKIIFIFVLLSFSGIAISEGKNPFEIQPFAIPKGVPEIHKQYRSKWSRLSGFELSGLHWNQFVVVYTNIGAKTYHANFFEYIKELELIEEDEDYEATYSNYPEGTVVLKENYLIGDGVPGDPTSLTVMIKRSPSVSPKAGNWEYIESDVSGNIIVRGEAENPVIKQRCSGCHENIKERDYIFSTFYKDTGRKR